jgi:hypothetical protein
MDLDYDFRAWGRREARKMRKTEGVGGAALRIVCFTVKTLTL